MYLKPSRKNFGWKAAIFDWDGTIVDSINEGIEGIINTAQSAGCIIPDNVRSSLRETLANSDWLSVLQRSLGLNSQKALEVRDLWFEYEKKHPPSLIPGALNALKHTSNLLDGRVCMVTSRSLETLMPVLDHYQDHAITEKFAHITARDHCTLHKPHPEAFDRTMKYLDSYGIYESNCFYVGDSKEDIMSALSRGIKPIGVTTGLHSREELISVGAQEEDVLDSIDNLLEWLVVHGF